MKIAYDNFEPSYTAALSPAAQIDTAAVKPVRRRPALSLTPLRSSGALFHSWRP